jgi:hypothetical protein
LKAVNLDSIKSKSMFRKIQIFVLAVATIGNINAQKSKLNSGERPKLVVGLV